MSTRNNDIKAKAIDANWFLGLKAISRPLILQSLTPDSITYNIEKAKVFEIEGYNPNFLYPNLNIDLIKSAKESLVQLRQQVCQEELNKSIANLYKEKLDELILEQELMLASVNEDWESFIDLNVTLYGNLNRDYVKEQLHFLRTRTDLFNDIIVKADVDGELISKKPSPELFQKARLLIKGPDINAVFNQEYTSEEIVKTWNESLSKTMPEWQVIVDDNVTSMLVVHKQRKIKIPRYLKMNARKMRKLFVHEIGTHVYRREMGKKNRIQLFSIGLANNQSFEEGLATLRSQIVGSKFHQFGGFDKYLTLAIALGYVDGTSKNFNQTFILLKDYFLDRLNRKRPHNHHNFVIAQNRAWNCTFRAFRGGNPNIPGCCFLRDKIYHEGNRNVWRLLDTNPEYFHDVMLGKFDLANNIQRKLVLADSIQN